MDGTTDVDVMESTSVNTATATGFLRRYFERMESLPGWFFPDAALMFAAYNQLTSERVAPGTLEIGVFHGKSAIAVASLRGEAGTFTAIDVFDDLSSRDGSSHDVGMKAACLANMAEWFSARDRVRTIVAPSGNLLQFEGRTGCHFPETDTGVYAGYHPRDSADAIAALEAAIERGHQYLLFPGTSLWWLDHYDRFRAHLDTRYPRLWSDRQCVLYDVRQPGAKAVAG
jgi:hypothetical protein